MPVCNEKLFGNHGSLNFFDNFRMVNLPELVCSPKVVLNLYLWRNPGQALFQEPVDGQFVICIDHKDQVVIAFRGAHQPEAVHLRLSKSSLVRKNSRARVLKIEQPDKSFADLPLTVDLILLIVGIKPGFRILNESLFFQPLPKGGGCIRIIGVQILNLLVILRHPDDVVRSAQVIFFLQGARYFVVRLSDDLLEIPCDLWIETIGLKWVQVGHNSSGKKFSPRTRETEQRAVATWSDPVATARGSVSVSSVVSLFFSISVASLPIEFLCPFSHRDI